MLVSVGNREVIHSLANNPGARFSQFGFLQMIKRTENDSILIESFSTRKDIPRSIFQQLIAKASDEVRAKLERERPETAPEIQTVVVDVTGELHSIFGPGSKDYFCAKKTVSALHRYGDVGEKKIFEYARSHKFPEVTAGLSLLCNLPANLIERGLKDQTGETVIVFAKSLDFSWETTTALLFLGASDHKMPARDFDELGTRFSRLKIETAQSLIGLYRSREIPQQYD